MEPEVDEDGAPGGWGRRLLLAGGVVGGAVLVGAVLGLLLAGRSSGPSRSEALAKLTPLPADAVVAVPSRPDPLDDPAGIGSLHAGVALLGLDEVDEVSTAGGRRRAPEGSRLLVFRLGDWTCEARPCAPWRSLDPRVEIDGETRELPATGDTFVAVVPPGAEVVDLVVDADNYRQTVSLVDGEPGADNIALLADRTSERKAPLGETFTLAEHTSIALDDGAGGRADVFEREVGIEYAQLRFFLGGATPGSPGEAFLVVNAYSSYAGRTDHFILAPGEVAFVDADGVRYPARDLDPAPDKGLLGFEVPARVRSGTLAIGGTTDKVSSTGVSYVSTLERRDVPITVG